MPHPSLPRTPVHRGLCLLASLGIASLPALRVSAVTFPFGEARPTVFCSPGHATDIALEPGETVQASDVRATDAPRWRVTLLASGVAPNRVQHLLVVPTAPAAATDLVVATDRRTYHLELVSTPRDGVPTVTFTYPAEPTVPAPAGTLRQWLPLIGANGLMIALGFLAWWMRGRGPSPRVRRAWGPLASRAAPPMSAVPWALDDTVVTALTAGFVSDWRTVSADPGLQRCLLEHVYSYVRPESLAFARLNDFYAMHNPFLRAEVLTVEVVICRAVRRSEDTFEIEWTEDALPLQGAATARTLWRALVTVTLCMPTRAQDIVRNPTGFFIRDFLWDPIETDSEDRLEANPSGEQRELR